MKLFRKTVISLVLAIATIVGAIGAREVPVAEAGSIGTRAVWVAFYEYAKAGLSNRTEAAFTANAEKLFKNIKAYGCNTVYFHVRAFDDAIYPSKVVGWSKYMVTSGGRLGYDPLKILVEQAHKKGIKFHAWMNPYRVTTSKILNPAKTATINRIVKQVKEILNYDVDGIHFDDYFYTSQFPKVKMATRKKNVNKLIKKVYNTVKAKDKNLLFGISPAGNIEYCESIGADIKTWMSKSGYIDYIVPQIYWSDQYKLSNGKVTKLFTERLAAWQALNKSDIPMYIGLGVYRAGIKPDASDLGWSKKNTNLKSQITKILAANAEGYSLFAYSDLAASHAKKEMKNFLAAISKIKLNSTAITLKKGDTFTLTAKWWPTKYTTGGAISFKSLDESIATVDKNGVIKAVANEGKVKIQAYNSKGDKVKNCVVTVEG